MKRTFEFIASETKRVPFEIQDSFEYRPDKGKKWIQKSCFWVLDKIGAYRKDFNVTYETFIINPQSFMERLFRQRSYISREFNKDVKYLLIGAEDYAEIMQTKEIRQLISFGAEYNYGKNIMGLTVYIIPWMRGIILIPELRDGG